uniref:Uncharacterized protein n=1 Tax=Anguilla anguilla TaxID=7936 RepID=A0A0E9SKK4_ANGAN
MCDIMGTSQLSDKMKSYGQTFTGKGVVNSHLYGEAL